MELADHIAAALVLLAAGIYPVANTRRFRNELAQVAAGSYPRIKFYRGLIGWLWAISAIVFVLWLYQGYSFASLGFRATSGWRFWSVTAAVLAYSLLCLGYYLRLKKSPELRAKTRARLENAQAEQLTPREPGELRYWIVCSLSASSEEIVYRGFVLWYVGALTNIVVAAVVSVLLFAVVHSYQGAAGTVRVGALGVVFLSAYLLSDSLWPAIFLHVVQDVFGGAAGYLSLRSSPASLQT